MTSIAQFGENVLDLSYIHIISGFQCSLIQNRRLVFDLYRKISVLSVLFFEVCDICSRERAKWASGQNRLARVELSGLRSKTPPEGHPPHLPRCAEEGGSRGPSGGLFERSTESKRRGGTIGGAGLSLTTDDTPCARGSYEFCSLLSSLATGVQFAVLQSRHGQNPTVWVFRRGRVCTVVLVLFCHIWNSAN